MKRKTIYAALAGAVMGGIAAWPASAAIVKGYTDLYVTSMEGEWEQYGDDTQFGDWARCGGLCAKVRFSFSHDTDRPSHETTIGLELLAAYQGGLPPTRIIDGKRYLPLQPYSFDNIARSYPLLGPNPAPGEFSGPPENWRTDSFRLDHFRLGPPGPGFRFESFAERVALWGEDTCSPDEQRYHECLNLQRATPSQSDVGPFFGSHHFIIASEGLSISNAGYGYYESRSDDFHSLATDYDIGLVSRIRYTFDNNPANWVDGPPKACTWIASGTSDDTDPCARAVPEPATVALLGLGLATLMRAARTWRGTT